MESNVMDHKDVIPTLKKLREAFLNRQYEKAPVVEKHLCCKGIWDERVDEGAQYSSIDQLIDVLQSFINSKYVTKFYVTKNRDYLLTVTLSFWPSFTLCLSKQEKYVIATLVNYYG